MKKITPLALLVTTLSTSSCIEEKHRPQGGSVVVEKTIDLETEVEKTQDKEKEFILMEDTPYGSYTLARTYKLQNKGERKGEYVCSQQDMVLVDNLDTQFRKNTPWFIEYDLRIIRITADCKGEILKISSDIQKDYPKNPKSSVIRCYVEPECKNCCTKKQIESAKKILNEIKIKSNYLKYKTNFEKSLNKETDSLDDRLERYL